MVKTQEPSFPDHAHQQLLRLRCAISDSKNNVTGYNTDRLSEPERWQWYAYDHAFHRVATGDLLGGAPTDPLKQWFNNDLVNLAETRLRKELGCPEPPKPTPASPPKLVWDSFLGNLGARATEKKD